MALIYGKWQSLLDRVNIGDVNTPIDGANFDNLKYLVVFSGPSVRVGPETFQS